MTLGVNNYHIRMVQAASMRTFPVPVESNFYKLASQASMDYSKKSKDMSRDCVCSHSGGV